LVRVFGPELVSRFLVWALQLKESEANAASVEAALFLIGVAGGLHLIDHLIGASSGWMRYLATAMELNEELIAYQWRWHELLARRAAGGKCDKLDAKEVGQGSEATLPAPVPNSGETAPTAPPPNNSALGDGSAAATTSQSKSTPCEPSEVPLALQQFELARAFSEQVLSKAREESKQWAAEFSAKIDQFEKHLTSSTLSKAPDKR
jgi:hypothetical protein